MIDIKVIILFIIGPGQETVSKFTLKFERELKI